MTDHIGGAAVGLVVQGLVDVLVPAGRNTLVVLRGDVVGIAQNHVGLKARGIGGLHRFGGVFEREGFIGIRAGLGCIHQHLDRHGVDALALNELEGINALVAIVEEPPLVPLGDALLILAEIKSKDRIVVERFDLGKIVMIIRCGR